MIRRGGLLVRQVVQVAEDIRNLSAVPCAKAFMFRTGGKIRMLIEVVVEDLGRALLRL